MPYALAKDTISRELSEAGAQLAEAIEKGQITGLVFGAAIRGRRYIVNVAGSLARDPTLARGIVSALDDELAGMVRGGVDSDTTQ